LNNQFGPDAWDEYCRRINEAAPPAAALGVTEYCSIEGYKAVIQRRDLLRHVEFIFPNVELRLATANKAGAAINVHLLFDPSESSHVETIESALTHLVFQYDGGKYGCTRRDLVKLGRDYDGTANLSDDAAYEAGVNQFKVPFEALRDWYESDQWLRDHCLIALAAGKDGTSGLKEGGLQALREDMERFAHAMFSSNAKDRDFWLARGAAATDHEQRYGWPKACLHQGDRILTRTTSGT